ELAREGTIPDTENTSHVPASSRASSLPQGPLNTRGSGVVREGTIPDTENTSDVPPHSRASSLPQGPINIRSGRGRGTSPIPLPHHRTCGFPHPAVGLLSVA
ncbi:hypothetical protein, partial [Pseudomonas syringae]